MALDGVKFSDFVRGLPAASEADLAAGNNMPIVSASDLKKMGGDEIAKRDIVNAFVDGVMLRQTAQSFELGFLASDGSVSSSTSRSVSDYIDVEGYQRITTFFNVASIYAASDTFACFYDENKNFIKNEKHSPSSNQVIESFDVPVGAKYIRFTINGIDKSFVFGLCGQKIVMDFLGNANRNIVAFKKERGFLASNGSVSSSTTRFVTDYINVERFMYIETLGGVASIGAASNTFACFYDKNKIFLSAVLKTGEASNNVLEKVSVPLGASYVRFTINNEDYDANLSIVGASNIQGLSDDVSNLLSVIGSVSNYGISSLAEATDHAYLNADGNLAESTSRGVTGYIDVSGLKKIKTYSGVASIIAASNTFACFYDENKNFFSAVKHSTNVNDVAVEFGVPSCAKYVRFTTNTYDTSAVVYKSSFEVVKNAVANARKILDKNNGKRFSLFGGSLTYNFHRVYKISQKWIDELRIPKFLFYGVGGAGFSNLNTNNIQAQVTNASADSDVFVLWCSGNDYYGHYEVGTASDYTSDDNYDESKRTTQAGGMNYCIKTIYEKNPLATIVIFTSLPIFQSKNGWVKNHTESGFYLCDYVRVQKEVAARWGIPCFDQFENCGFGELNYSQFFLEDKGHINDVGYNSIVGKQIDFLKNA